MSLVQLILSLVNPGLLFWFALLPTSFLRLEEKLSDIETEDQILRHQTLLNSSSRKTSEAQVMPQNILFALIIFFLHFTPLNWLILSSATLQTLQNGHHVSEQ